MKISLRSTLVLSLALLSGCASLGMLGQVVQPPRFEVAREREAEIRLLPPAPGRPLGGAAVRLWARVENPNPLGITLSSLNGDLFLEGREAARVGFPLGVPLRAGEATLVPLEVSIGFAEVPGLASVLTRAVVGEPVRYRLAGTVGVDAGAFGEPVFGPMTLLDGEVRVTR